jgi:hypothetical protein
MNSLTKTSLIATAVAAALGSNAAFAVAPSVTPDYTLYAAGGSAQAGAFYVAASRILTNVDSYTDATGGADSGSYRVVYGTTNITFTFNGFTVPTGKNVLILYKFNGGSFPNGAAPQAGAGSTLPYPTVASILAGTQISGVTQGTGKPTYQYNSAGALTNNQIPDWGITDLEVPTLDATFNLPTGVSPVTVGAADRAYDNLFGVAVTAALYNAAGHPKTNFSKAEVEGILGGFVTDWSQLFDDNGAQLPAGGIILLDRQAGSGTKASGSQYFLGYPAASSLAVTPGSQTFGYTGTNPGRIVIPSPGYQDVAESSSGNEVADLLTAQANGLRAIAVLGLEFPPLLHQATSGTNAYFFAKINGVAVDTGTTNDDINVAVHTASTGTSYINAIKGNYDFYFQNSFNTRTGFLAGNSVNAAFANEFKTLFGQASFAGANSGQAFPAAVPGTLIDADASTALAAGVTVNTRNGNSGAPLQQKFNAVATGLPASHDPL